MNWFDWLRKQETAKSPERETPHQTPHTVAAGAEEDTPGVPTPDGGGTPSELAGLDFYSAIATHQRWKNRLKAVVNGQSQEVLDPAVVGRCDVCALGQWLATQDSDPRIAPDLMARLKQEHAQFHKLAAEIIRLSDQGLQQQAMDALRTDAPYNRTSHRITKLLSQLHLDLSEFHKPTFGQ